MDSVAGDTTINWDITKDSVDIRQDSIGGGFGGSYNFNIWQFWILEL
jgi:hypothetical protein